MQYVNEEFRKIFQKDSQICKSSFDSTRIKFTPFFSKFQLPYLISFRKFLN
jgi:hypothetical protein